MFPQRGPLPDVPHATDAEIDMLLDTVNTALAVPLDRSDVLATFAGLRPLLTHAGTADGRRAATTGEETSDLSRRHAIIESSTGILSVVGGKLTTYRRMAQDGLDAAVERRFRAGEVIACRHALAAARGCVATRTHERDRGGSATGAPLRRGGAVRRIACLMARPPRAESPLKSSRGAWQSRVR